MWLTSRPTRCPRAWPAWSRWPAPSPPPRRLLLDEPSSGLNAEETHTSGGVLQQLASEGMGVLLVEHDMTLVMAICTRVDVLDNGQVIAQGDPAAGAGQPAVQEAYLGGETESGDRRRLPARRRRAR